MYNLCANTQRRSRYTVFQFTKPSTTYGSQTVSRYSGPYPGGGSGGSAEPPLQINDIHDYCYAFKKLRAEMYVL